MTISPSKKKTVSKSKPKQNQTIKITDKVIRAWVKTELKKQLSSMKISCPSRHGKLWSITEDESLRKEFAKFCQDTAKKHKRLTNAITYRIQKHYNEGMVDMNMSDDNKDCDIPWEDLT